MIYDEVFGGMPLIIILMAIACYANIKVNEDINKRRRGHNKWRSKYGKD